MAPGTQISDVHNRFFVDDGALHPFVFCCECRHAALDDILSAAHCGWQLTGDIGSLTRKNRMDYDQITANLYIGTQPAAGDYDRLREIGISLIINMRYESGPVLDKHPEPIETLWLRTFDSPLLPIPVRALVRGAEKALPVLQQGGKVYVHCAQGIHRGPAMAACILIAQGYSKEEAIARIKRQRPVSDPGIFYIRWRINRFEKAWRRRHT
jgi:protein tyrosine phosphatase (PTP) superfamily phosphohydrolase (DUF442 family)